MYSVFQVIRHYHDHLSAGYLCMVLRGDNVFRFPGDKTLSRSPECMLIVYGSKRR